MSADLGKLFTILFIFTAGVAKAYEVCYETYSYIYSCSDGRYCCYGNTKCCRYSSSGGSSGGGSGSDDDDEGGVSSGATIGIVVGITIGIAALCTCGGVIAYAVADKNKKVHSEGQAGTTSVEVIATGQPDPPPYSTSSVSSTSSASTAASEQSGSAHPAPWATEMPARTKYPTQGQY